MTTYAVKAKITRAAWNDIKAAIIQFLFLQKKYFFKKIYKKIYKKYFGPCMETYAVKARIRSAT